MTATETIRPFAPDDLGALLELRARCFDGLDMQREGIRRSWAFDDNPARVDGVPSAWVAVLDGKLVGTYGMMPAKVAIDGTPTPAICGVDFCVAPEMRGRGLGRRLTAAMVDTEGSRFRFITSPTAPTTALMKERGAGVVNAAAEAALFARPGNLAPGDPGDPAVEVRRLESFGSECDDLATRINNHHRFVTVRDAAYLDWRYLRDPFIRHEAFGAFDGDTLRGLAVLTFSPTEPQAYIAELMTEPADVATARALLGALVTVTHQQRLEALFGLERRAAIKPLMTELGFSAVPQNLLEPVVLLRDAEVDPLDWHFTPGDGDFLFRIGSAG